ncbi:hypothetical protein FRP1_29330 (plasmid) [Pseudonocardia sp. EC080625-04]|uniref:hypothetical protein n=1 Tax=unclassified Pseudonocardia TaxID=2619320 RepID=UPI0006CB0776|nr:MULTISPECIES: hypothetical protein [unclassified Pseudonocardia]ALE76877.1 hypothetical protein FRP1_29330 [Pseudonocardia sp. EC080625-04]ALL85838.1 hypothetical protein AD017_32305 [Pseudonocardia sp. EC080619-01]
MKRRSGQYGVVALTVPGALGCFWYLVREDVPGWVLPATIVVVAAAAVLQTALSIIANLMPVKSTDKLAAIDRILQYMTDRRRDRAKERRHRQARRDRRATARREDKRPRQQNRPVRTAPAPADGTPPAVPEQRGTADAEDVAPRD